MSFNDDRSVARDGRKTIATRFVFTREERELLVNLVSRHKAIIENKKNDALAKRAKDSAWEKLMIGYNSQPKIRHVMVAQLRGGQSPAGPISPSLALVEAAASHMGTQLQNPYDSDGAQLNQPVLFLSPSRIFENMLTRIQDNTEELLGKRGMGVNCQL
ncbi:hypothetical protein MRX96_052358 [Rhipicephalus microplus]